MRPNCFNTRHFSGRHGGRHGGFGAFAMGMAMGAAAGRGGGRRPRVFDGGELRLVLLKLIEEQPRHGYDLIREIEARSGGAYAPSPGIVYPTLTLLLDMGLAEEEASEGARKRLAITEGGVAHLAENAEAVEAAMARLQALADVRERTDGASVRRAMHNLKSALHGRLSQEGVDKKLIHDVVDLIDEAARKIERL
ncbi:PadR family transcriptional regulator [Sphingoaurantiacus capsulatus]|uniref:PadR family transcriptional regulator n=1 Tax=Sphingoaurantiacus capsulatus TaxID=1771310 RepID=A0ABV7X5E8_9SPHN